MAKTSNKFIARPRLAVRLQSLKRRGKKIVLANGCYDLLHVGHLRYLKDASKKGDVLVVALNTDASVRKLKGAGRPLMPLKERAELLSAIECVDFVTSFGEATAEKTLRLLKPHFQAKGTDYTVKTVPEREVLKEIGARPVICGDPKNHSTTSLIRKVKKAFK